MLWLQSHRARLQHVLRSHYAACAPPHHPPHCRSSNSRAQTCMSAENNITPINHELLQTREQGRGAAGVRRHGGKQWGNPPLSYTQG